MSDSTIATRLLSDQAVFERVFNHIDNSTTDLGERVWREPADNYYSQERFDAEIAMLKRLPVAYCPSAALPDKGSYIARSSAGTPLVVVRGLDGVVRAFINACRHRGMQVASGRGCSRAFVCPYHAWTYNLEGNLKHIPGQEGFPGVDPEQHGLVEVSAREKGGIVYVMQKGEITEDMLEDCLDYFSPEQQMFETEEMVDEANWKILNETLMEGYHIKSLHSETFYPYGLDNINLVEIYGANSRVTYPFRRIEKMRDVAPDQRRIDGLVTSVYLVFPTASVSVLSKHTNLAILEPLSPTSSRWVLYRMVNRAVDGKDIPLEEAQRDALFVGDSGQIEDREAARAIQQSVSSNGNTHFTFGHFESAIVNFHQHLAKYLDNQ
ncbi:aromatic ring-hydroxylating dioxygenase subunit alpha [SAR92 clade bacterium H231]|jgi:nitrite reductase/ring-hydroxylating ferredoxin subunit|nr:aromatic ring-hydroxylating dioxygenase subunit alpha [Porticoccaceae bacterium]MCT2532005.1 aromatic ring-hydroxylating dioxygenase subunit alpha [SAR92 clade bacterium H231]MDA7815999.1 aromatic ring-hydroxylating dioxygenase subunit alpha [Porticoccaceae bacterium]MDB2549409.1 aromatic ring-hydroxylating dioxygenase subunit alpha [Porticoccaceae bacterium]MDG1446817.1 aromatic ring-hydroxylating dioxygenase subunit alpha [Porticoccaceae bacterium]